MDTITGRLLAELRARGHSWYRIARLVDVSEQALTKQRRGDSIMSDETAVRACEALGKSQKETGAVLAGLAMERAGDERTRAAWAAALKKLGGAAAAVLIAMAGAGPTPPPPPGAVAAVQNQSCVLCKIARRKRRRAAWADTLTRTARAVAALLGLTASAFLAGCAGTYRIPDSAPQAVELRWVRVAPHELPVYCYRISARHAFNVAGGAPLFGCSGYSYDASAGRSFYAIYTAPDVTESLLGHELLHWVLGSDFHD